MELRFADPQLAALCSSRARLDARFGAALARAVCCRLHELEAAMTLGELRLLPHLHLRVPAARPSVLHLDLVPPACIAVGRGTTPDRAGGPSIDWSATEPIVVMEIGARPDPALLERRER